MIIFRRFVFRLSILIVLLTGLAGCAIFKATPTPTQMPLPTPTPLPTLTPLLTSTPLPTPTLLPTSTPPPTSNPELSVKEIVNLTNQSMLAVKSLHFAIALSGKPTFLKMGNLPATALKHVEGDLVRPDKIQMQMQVLVKVSILKLDSEIELISTEGKSYIKNPLNQRWEELPQTGGKVFDPTLLFDAKQGIPAVIVQIPLKQVGIEQVEGKNLYHLQGGANGKQVKKWTAGFISKGDVPIDVWIDTNSYLIYKVRMAELSSNPENPTVWDITFSNFDQPVDIQPPPLGK